jgi:hypothetical protein
MHDPDELEPYAFVSPDRARVVRGGIDGQPVMPPDTDEIFRDRGDCIGSQARSLPSERRAMSMLPCSYIGSVSSVHWFVISHRHRRKMFEAVQPHGTGGVYVNFLGDEGADRVRVAYGTDKYARLAGVKPRWDPENLFHLSQNILPSTCYKGSNLLARSNRFTTRSNGPLRGRRLRWLPKRWRLLRGWPGRGWAPPRLWPGVC